MSLPTDPSHPLIQRLLNEAVASRGGWTSGAPTNTLDALLAFYHAIHWRQSFFFILLSFHFSLLLLSLLLRHSPISQLLLLSLLLALVSSSEYLNSIAHSHWQLLVTEDYFDQNGIFTSIVWNTPLTIIAFINLCFLLYEASHMLIVVKRKQLLLQRKFKEKREKERKEEGGGAEGGGEGGESSSSSPLPSTMTQRKAGASQWLRADG